MERQITQKSQHNTEKEYVGKITTIQLHIYYKATRQYVLAKNIVQWNEIECSKIDSHK